MSLNLTINAVDLPRYFVLQKVIQLALLLIKQLIHLLKSYIFVIFVM
jgi:hypothetical protein